MKDMKYNKSKLYLILSKIDTILPKSGGDFFRETDGFRNAYLEEPTNKLKFTRFQTQSRSLGPILLRQKKVVSRQQFTNGGDQNDNPPRVVGEI